jgi:hypothetical protein
MKIPFAGAAIDERFLEHRRRSTSYGGITGGLVAIALFAYRFYVNGTWSWDLFAVAATIVVVKVGCMLWYHITD